jgi:hypothetical protein
MPPCLPAACENALNPGRTLRRASWNEQYLMLYTTGWHSHSDCLCYNTVQSVGWIIMFCESILLVRREHSALTKKGHSLVSSTILWTQKCPVQLCLLCQVRHWQCKTFILPLQRKSLYTSSNVFTFIWVQRFKLTKVMIYTLDFAQIRNCSSLSQVFCIYIKCDPTVSPYTWRVQEYL